MFVAGCRGAIVADIVELDFHVLGAAVAIFEVAVVAFLSDRLGQYPIPMLVTNRRRSLITQPPSLNPHIMGTPIQILPIPIITLLTCLQRQHSIPPLVTNRWLSPSAPPARIHLPAIPAAAIQIPVVPVITHLITDDVPITAQFEAGVRGKWRTAFTSVAVLELTLMRASITVDRVGVITLLRTCSEAISTARDTGIMVESVPAGAVKSLLYGETVR